MDQLSVSIILQNMIAPRREAQERREDAEKAEDAQRRQSERDRLEDEKKRAEEKEQMARDAKRLKRIQKKVSKAAAAEHAKLLAQQMRAEKQEKEARQAEKSRLEQNRRRVWAARKQRCNRTCDGLNLSRGFIWEFMCMMLPCTIIVVFLWGAGFTGWLLGGVNPWTAVFTDPWSAQPMIANDAICASPPSHFGRPLKEVTA